MSIYVYTFVILWINCPGLFFCMINVLIIVLIVITHSQLVSPKLSGNCSCFDKLSVCSSWFMVSQSHNMQCSFNLIGLSVLFIILAYLVMVWAELFSFASLMLLWCGMLFSLSFCPLHSVIFLWLWLFLVLCCALSCCVSFVQFPVGTLFNCPLWMYVLFYYV